jgi:cytochrome b involved in lipid metabolism
MIDKYMDNVISAETVAKHSTRESCWIIVHGLSSLRSLALYLQATGNVYDVTSFLDGESKLCTYCSWSYFYS